MLDRILEMAFHWVYMWGQHFGWTPELRDVGNSILRWLNM